MKIRTGFVSNSSSTSYVCDVCGRDVSGWDLDLSEEKMKVCENNHTICDSHILEEISIQAKRDLVLESGVEDWLTYAKDLNDEDFKEKWDEEGMDSEFDLIYEYPVSGCPICQLKVLIPEDGLKYLLVKHNITEKD